MEFINKYKKFLSIYLVWFFLQLFVWIYSAFKYDWIDDDKIHYFYPFEATYNDWRTIGHYDITEFMAYSLIPLLLFILFLAFKKT
jgi:hypothetical protein